ncbi:MAG: rod shape-determining protein MreC [candidate division WS6 bacterium GW2011_GWA2_37_6]|uniref:Cell shape-determining protein MreC n=1 Tax=candidate division WS6 bacterium GW2011_GWA2_37_6 TaxID=1619087 RepID=A0A0G0K4S9_9BACT|nr:MAG: rod shape-determining protein MreC [candidate division WS6 bacterium GW2011_GWA2_37_6]
MGPSSENIDHNFIKLSVLSIVAVGFILASSVGVFDKLYSLTKGVQSGYRSQINKQAEKVVDVFETVSDIAAVKKDRDQQKNEVIILREEVVRLEQELKSNKVKNDQIQSISGDFQSKYKLVPAYVVRYKQEEPSVMEINKGSKDGVEKGDIIVFHMFAIGEVIDVNDYTSDVKTILSPDNKIAVVSEKGVKGILRSQKGRELQIEEILIDSDVKVGDDFFTSGKNSSYIQGLYIGQVEKIETQASNTTKIAKIKNEIDFNSLNEVFILKHED